MQGIGYKGEYNHAVDVKGRLIVPAKFRELLGEHFVVTKGMDGCLWLFDEAGWNMLEGKIQALPVTNAKARQLSRFFLASAVDCEIDKQGRILIPQPLRTFAGLDKDATFVGVGGHIEIWDQAKWEEANNIDLDAMGEEIGQLGI